VYTSPMEPKFYYTLFLPVFKQGDDLSHHQNQNNPPNQAKAFSGLAEQYISAAEICRKMSKVLETSPEIEVEADTHHIGLFGPVNLLDPLVEEGILSKDEVEDDEDCEEDESGEDFDFDQDDPM
jgi:hypothetical protein